MIHVSKFVKDHIPLCAFTLGFAILGYLGYHLVRWIIHKCQKVENIDQVAQNILAKQPTPNSPPKSLLKRVSNVEMSPDKITLGQGEYVVFHKLPSGEKKELSRETFEAVYKILLDHSPLALVAHKQDPAVRYELLNEKLKELDPSLVAVFVPRTLYELIFIRKCIKEDIKHNEICPQLSPLMHGILKKYQQDKPKCWHRCYFKDSGDNEHAGVKDVSYRLNNVIAKAFDPSCDGFTFQDYSTFAEKEIQFLKNHYKNSLEATERRQNGDKTEALCNNSTPGPTTNFGFESTYGSIKSMCIRNETDAQLIRDAVALDCSRLAQKALLLYRGADFQKDAPVSWSDKDKSYSLSYGTSLFAGCLFDGGATAFYYMRKEQNAYALPIAFDQLADSPFYVPTTHSVAQLFASGEIFHARTKAWKDFDVEKIGGMNMGENGHIRIHLKSNLNQLELISQFNNYKNEAIQLK